MKKRATLSIWWIPTPLVLCIAWLCTGVYYSIRNPDTDPAEFAWTALVTAMTVLGTLAAVVLVLSQVSTQLTELLYRQLAKPATPEEPKSNSPGVIDPHTLPTSTQDEVSQTLVEASSGTAKDVRERLARFRNRLLGVADAAELLNVADFRSRHQVERAFKEASEATWRLTRRGLRQNEAKKYVALLNSARKVLLSVENE